MRYLFVLILSAGTVLATAQTSLNDFQKISVSGNVKLILKQGNSPSYTASGNTSELKVRVEQGKLKITNNKVFKDWDKPVVVEVTYTSIRALYASAGAQVQNEGTLNVGDFELSVDTGANGDLLIDAQSLDARVGEGGVLRLEGSGRVLEASSTTGGVLKARDFIAHTVYVKANTGAMASVHASESIEANASMGGSITYSGNPQNVKSKESLGGSIRG
ncbi:MAG: head GIN domain-containing protein [Saprospiraceae bacterium]|nr:head GIN domain-containing protein [Saprospiraceae bacterium]